MCARLNLAEFIPVSSRRPTVLDGSDTPERAQSFPDSSRGAKAALPTVGLESAAAGNRDGPRERRILGDDGDRIDLGGTGDVVLETEFDQVAPAPTCVEPLDQAGRRNLLG